MNLGNLNMRTHSTGNETVEMYLKTIAELGDGETPVSVARLAERLGVTPVSANEMMKRLAEQELQPAQKRQRRLPVHAALDARRGGHRAPCFDPATGALGSDLEGQGSSLDRTDDEVEPRRGRQAAEGLRPGRPPRARG